MKTEKKLARIAITIIVIILISGYIYSTFINPSVKSYKTPQTKNIGSYVVSLIKCEGTIMTLSVKNTTGSRIIYIDKGPGVGQEKVITEDLTIINSDSASLQTYEGNNIDFFEEVKNGDNIKIKSSGRLKTNIHFISHYDE